MTTADGTHDFTERELQIFFALCLGLGNKDMTQKFRITESTVQTIMCSIYEKAGLSTRLELAAWVKHALNGELRRGRGDSGAAMGG